MSRIAKNKAARVRANLGAAPLQVKKEQQKKESAVLSLTQMIFDLEIDINHKMNEIEKLKYTLEYLRMVKKDA